MEASYNSSKQFFPWPIANIDNRLTSLDDSLPALTAARLEKGTRLHASVKTRKIGGANGQSIKSELPLSILSIGDRPEVVWNHRLLKRELMLKVS
jgi:hypothetical protein